MIHKRQRRIVATWRTVAIAAAFWTVGSAARAAAPAGRAVIFRDASLAPAVFAAAEVGKALEGKSYTVTVKSPSDLTRVRNGLRVVIALADESTGHGAKHQAQAMARLTDALAHWKRYADVASKLYTPQLLARTRRTDWKKITGLVANDVTIARREAPPRGGK